MKEEQEMMPVCSLFGWRCTGDREFFKDMRKRINAKFKWDSKLGYMFIPWAHSRQEAGWCTPFASVIAHDRQALVGRMLKNGAHVDAPCVGFDCKPDTLRPIELLQFATKSAFLVLKRNPSIEFCVGNTGIPFHLTPDLPESVQRYIWQKRMYAMCFCLTFMGQSWPDLAWVMKDFLL
jgi:hypothetical protein